MRKIEKWLSTVIDETPKDEELGTKIRKIYLDEKKNAKEEEINWKEVLDIGDGELKEWYDKLPLEQKTLLNELWN